MFCHTKDTPQGAPNRHSIADTHVGATWAGWGSIPRIPVVFSLVCQADGSLLWSVGR
jgi:hypothetical protein